MILRENLGIMESSYRKHYLEADKRQSIYSLFYLQVPNLSFIFSDVYFFRQDPYFWPILMIRFWLVLLPLCLGLLIPKLTKPLHLDRLNLILTCLLVGHLLIIHSLRPEMFLSQVGIDGLAILSCYLMFPNSLRNRLIPALSYSLIILMVLVQDRLPTVNMNSVFLILFFSNIMGAFISNQFQYYRRKRYRSYSHLMATQRKLERLANQDPLTELANRRSFIEFGTAEWERFSRYGRDFSILLIDIDHFKLINDQFGHSAGDAALLEFSNQIREMVRASDMLARIGGEEFGLLLPETQKEAALDFARRLGETIRDLKIATEQGVFSFSVSIGVAQAKTSDRNLSDMMNRADRALYEAKDRGRDQICVA